MVLLRARFFRLNVRHSFKKWLVAVLVRVLFSIGCCCLLLLAPACSCSLLLSPSAALAVAAAGFCTDVLLFFLHRCRHRHRRCLSLYFQPKPPPKPSLQFTPEQELVLLDARAPVCYFCKGDGDDADSVEGAFIRVSKPLEEYGADIHACIHTYINAYNILGLCSAGQDTFRSLR